jgi:hypothetical protein
MTIDWAESAFLAQAVRMRCFLGRVIGRHMKMAVPYAALRQDRIRESLDLGQLATKDRDFEAVVMIEMHMKSRHRELVVVVLLARKPFGEIARLMFIDIRERRNAGAASSTFRGLFDLGFTDEVANRFRAACVASPVAQAIECFEETVIDCDRDALHGQDLPLLSA